MKRVFVFLLLILVLGAAASIGVYAYSAHLESNDAFCASCHTEPESTYYQQSLAPEKATLAAFHSAEGTRCIDCHSGKGSPAGSTPC